MMCQPSITTIAHFHILVMMTFLAASDLYTANIITGKFQLANHGTTGRSTAERLETSRLKYDCAGQCSAVDDCYGFVISIKNGTCRLKIYGQDMNPHENGNSDSIRCKVSEMFMRK